MSGTPDQDGDWLLLQDLNFGLDNLDSLSTVQLCMVQFHPEADETVKVKAELAYWRRRVKAQARARAAPWQAKQVVPHSRVQPEEDATKAATATPPIAAESNPSVSARIQLQEAVPVKIEESFSDLRASAPTVTSSINVERPTVPEGSPKISQDLSTSSAPAPSATETEAAKPVSNEISATETSTERKVETLEQQADTARTGIELPFAQTSLPQEVDKSASTHDSEEAAAQQLPAPSAQSDTPSAQAFTHEASVERIQQAIEQQSEGTSKPSELPRSPTIITEASVERTHEVIKQQSAVTTTQTEPLPAQAPQSDASTERINETHLQQSKPANMPSAPTQAQVSESPASIERNVEPLHQEQSNLDGMQVDLPSVQNPKSPATSKIPRPSEVATTPASTVRLGSHERVGAPVAPKQHKPSVGMAQAPTLAHGSKAASPQSGIPAAEALKSPAASDVPKSPAVMTKSASSISLGSHQIVAAPAAVPNQPKAPAHVSPAPLKAHASLVAESPAVQTPKTLSSRMEPQSQGKKPDLASRLGNASQVSPSEVSVKSTEVSTAEKRKRGNTPPPRNPEEPPTNRPKKAGSNYDRFAAQRREPSIEAPGSEVFGLVATNPSEQKATALTENGQKNHSNKDELVPVACIKDLACLFIGNIPPSSTDADIRPWLFSSNMIPKPMVVTPLGHARSIPNAQRYLRVLFEKKTQAEQAMHLLKNVPFTSPPAQLVVKVMELKPGKLKLHWRDVESWARPVLKSSLKPKTPQEQLKTGVSSLPKRPEEEARPVQSREEPRAAMPREDRFDDRRFDSRRSRSPPRRRNRSPSNDSVRDYDRLASRLRDEPRYTDRRESDARRRSLSERTQGSSSMPRPAQDEVPRDSFASRVRDQDRDVRRPRSSWPEERRRDSNDDVFRRFDASPPRRAQERRYSPDREPPRREGSNLLGRLQ